jgi:predicted nucleic acid-binding protein
MTDVFIDTSGWVCHFDQAQPQHAAAKRTLGVCLAQGSRLLTTNYVITELVALLTTRTRIPRPQMITCVETIKTWAQVMLLHVDPTLDADAWTLLKARPDKTWSLVDCASFVVMRQQGILEALTTDHHFEQAGFVRLLKP